MSTRRDLFTWLILASVFFIPLQLPVGASSRLSIADFLVALATPLLLMRFCVVRRAALVAPLLFPLVMVYGALLGGLVNGQVLPHAIMVKILGALVLLFSLLSWLQVAQETDRGIFDLMKSFLLGSTLFTIIGMVEFYADVSIITVRFIESRFSGGYFDPNHYGAITGVGLVLIISLGTDIFKRFRYAIIIGGILGAGLVLCISRGSWLATVMGLAVVLLLRPIRIKPYMIAMSGFILIVIAFSGIVEKLIEDINDRPDNVSHRMSLIKEGLNMLEEGHYIGIGLSVFLKENEIIIHNSAVWMLVEMGIVGLALYILFIAEPLIRLMALRFRHWKRAGRKGDLIARTTAALLGSHVVMTLASLNVEATYQRQWWLILALTFALLTRATLSTNKRYTSILSGPS
jgi:hypothetical protein